MFSSSQWDGALALPLQTSGDKRPCSSSARGAVTSFLERLERDGAAREEGFRQLQQRVRRERDGQRRNPQNAHLDDLRFLR